MPFEGLITRSRASASDLAPLQRRGALVLLALVACRGEAADPPRPRAGPAVQRGAVGAPPLPQRVPAVVARVADGDSLVVTFADGRRGDVRLQGIDAPEAGQPWGREAGEELRRDALGREVELELRGLDAYGRHLAVATGAEGDLGLAQIRRGLAWHNRLYASEQEPAVRERYAAAERAARAERRGLWAEAAPVAPWNFKSGGRASEASGAAVPQRRQGRIVGNRRSGLYHLPGCPGHAATSSRNAVTFESEAAARRAGYRRAGNC